MCLDDNVNFFLISLQLTWKLLRRDTAVLL